MCGYHVCINKYILCRKVHVMYVCHYNEKETLLLKDILLIVAAFPDSL
jgi:hypothetical protein